MLRDSGAVKLQTKVLIQPGKESTVEMLSCPAKSMSPVPSQTNDGPYLEPERNSIVPFWQMNGTRGRVGTLDRMIMK